jgi:hypothetical protein
VKRIGRHTQATLKGRCIVDEKCWLWQGATSSNGHPVVRIGDQEYRVRRLLWEFIKGAAPTGQLYANCQNPECVNPACMSDVTRAEMIALRTKDGWRPPGKLISMKHRANPPKAKLDWPTVREIRARLDGGEEVVDMVGQYPVNTVSLYNIAAYRTWPEGILA